MAKVEEKLPCSICGKLLKNKRGLSIHMGNAHGCNHCDGHFKDLPYHIKSVHNTEQCRECDMRFATEGSLKGHMDREHKIKCEICDEKFFNKSTLNEHIQENHEEDCYICQERFLTTSNLLKPHLEAVHGIKPKIVKQFAGGMFMMISE